MKRRIVEWYIKNKKTIQIIIFIAIVVIIVNLIVKYLSKLEIEKSDLENINENISTEQKIGNYTDIYVKDDTSVITDEKITSSQITMLETIDKFFNYCNAKKIDEAYNLLSDECKEEVYSSIESFKSNYYDKIFNGNNKNITTECWNNNIYKVKIEDDALSSGVYTQNNTIQDYITIVQNKDEEIRLNINGYIGRKELNKETTTENITITTLKSDTFMDYQIYTFRITNNTDNTILLDDKNNIDNMYLEDENSNKYTAYINEISEEKLTISPGETKEIVIKYYNKYSSTKRIKNIVFNKIILNHNENAVRNFAKVQIEI